MSIKITRYGRAALLCSSATMLAAAFTGSAIAQQQQEELAIEEVVVTGSRIARANLENPTPTIVLGSTEMTALGFENIADMATSLPQFAPSFGASRTQSTFSGAASSGLNSINLRNLGSVSTLVLINGRRAMAGSATSSLVDMATMPSANIERIEVITGGASAIYGADAVAGVVNIITKSRFEGLEVGASYGETFKGDNKNPTGYVMVGNNFGDGGHFLFTAQYDFQGRVKCADRYLCAEDFAWTTPATQIRGPAAYSGVGEFGRFFVGQNSYARRGNSLTDSNGQLFPFTTTIDGYNRNGRRDIAIPTRRLTIAMEAEYPVSDDITAFMEANYGNSQINAAFEGHPFQSSSDRFGGTQPTIPWNNPFIPQALRDQFATLSAADQAAGIAAGMTWWQRFSHFGDRGADNERQMVRLVGGLKGNFDSIGGLGSNWSWEASYNYGRFRLDSLTEGLVGKDRLFWGLRVEADPANPGQYRCTDPIARGLGCVPVNPFASYTQAQIDWLTLSAGQTGRSIMHQAQGWLSGSLFTLPAGDVKVAVGAEYRTFSGFLDYDEVINQGTSTGNQIGDVDYIKTRTKEVYGELIVPVLKDVPAIKSLEIEGAFRRSKASRTSAYNTWKFGGNWTPIEGLRFRAIKARSVRAAVPGELSGVGQTAGVVNDPCTASRRNLNATRAANCLADGVPANYAPALSVEQGVQGFVGGNPNLNPEKATTLTYGLVFTPDFLPRFSLTVDRFEIKIEGQISTVGRQIEADLCYDTTDRLFCDQLTRGAHPLVAGNYALLAVNDRLQNVAVQTVKGFDIESRYSFELGDTWGELNVSGNATIYDKASKIPLPGRAPIILDGQAGGSTSDQGWLHFQGNLNVSHNLGRFTTNYNMRYIGKADMNVGSTAAGYPKIGDAFYHNARVTFDATDWAQIYTGVTNIGNRKPPFFGSGRSGTQALDTVPGYYDVFGRSWYIGAKANF